MEIKTKNRYNRFRAAILTPKCAGEGVVSSLKETSDSAHVRIRVTAISGCFKKVDQLGAVCEESFIAGPAADNDHFC